MENYQENLVEWYGNLMLAQFKRDWQQMGAQKAKISPTTIRLIARSVADSIKECIRKEYTLEEIMEIAKEMQDFFSGGTKTLIENKAKEFNLI